jgi:hypothetical protein
MPGEDFSWRDLVFLSAFVLATRTPRNPTKVNKQQLLLLRSFILNLFSISYLVPGGKRQKRNKKVVCQNVKRKVANI